MSSMEDSEIIKLVVEAIKQGRFTIKHIVKELLPKKEKKTSDKKEYFKKYYEKNRKEIIERVIMNNNIKKASASKIKNTSPDQQIVSPEL